MRVFKQLKNWIRTFLYMTLVYEYHYEIVEVFDEETHEVGPYIGPDKDIYSDVYMYYKG